MDGEIDQWDATHIRLLNAVRILTIHTFLIPEIGKIVGRVHSILRYYHNGEPSAAHALSTS